MIGFDEVKKGTKNLQKSNRNLYPMQIYERFLKIFVPISLERSA
jgi:hypothetical protein